MTVGGERHDLEVCLLLNQWTADSFTVPAPVCLLGVGRYSSSFQMT